MDQDLVARAQKGDLQAFESLAVSSHPRLYRVALGILRDPHLAEDATQQALLHIWRDLRRLRDPAKFNGWSYRLLVRACYAEAKRKPQCLAEYGLGMRDEPWTSDATDVVLARDQLDRAFQHLSVDHRAVIVLRYLLDMTLAQVAETLDIPQGTVHSRLKRATDTMRAVLEADARPSTPLPLRQEVNR